MTTPAVTPQQPSTPQGLSSQDIQDIIAIRKQMPAGDPRAAKIDALLMMQQPQPLDQNQQQQLSQSYANRSLSRKIFGLGPSDETGKALEQQSNAFQSDQLGKSDLMRQQLQDKALGTAIVASPALIAGGHSLAAGLLAPTATTSSVGTGIMNAAGQEIMKDVTQFGPSALARVGTALAPIATKYGIKALQAAGAGAGATVAYKLYKELAGVFGGE